MLCRKVWNGTARAEMPRRRWVIPRSLGRGGGSIVCALLSPDSFAPVLLGLFMVSLMCSLATRRFMKPDLKASWAARFICSEYPIVGHGSCLLSLGLLVMQLAGLLTCTHYVCLVSCWDYLCCLWIWPHESQPWAIVGSLCELNSISM